MVTKEGRKVVKNILKLKNKLYVVAEKVRGGQRFLIFFECEKSFYNFLKVQVNI